MLRRGAYNFLYNDFQLNVQELRLQARFFKRLVWNHDLYLMIKQNWYTNKANLRDLIAETGLVITHIGFKSSIF